MTRLAFGELVTSSGESADDFCPAWWGQGVVGVIVGVETRPIAGESKEDPSYYVVSGANVDSFWREELNPVRRNVFTIALAVVVWCLWRAQRNIRRVLYVVRIPYFKMRARIRKNKRLKQLRNPWWHQ